MRTDIAIDDDAAAGCRDDGELARLEDDLAPFEVAAVCIGEGLPLLHDDRDFDHLAEVSDLRVIRLP